MVNDLIVRQIKKEEKRMRKSSLMLLMAVIGVMLLSAVPVFAAVTLDFSNISGASLNFNGDSTFNFIPTNANALRITGTHNTVGDSLNENGRITGTFTIGIPVSGVAPVTGAGSLLFTTGPNFSADLNWVSIATLGTGGTLNVYGVANLSNIVYSGTQVDLLAFANGGITAVTFQFIPGLTIDQLKTEQHSSSYSGTLTSVPEPGTLILLGSGLLGLALTGARKKFRK